MKQHRFSLFAVPEAPHIQRIAAGAGSHGAVGRGGSVRKHNLPETIENFRMRQPGQIFATLRKLMEISFRKRLREGRKKFFPALSFGRPSGETL